MSVESWNICILNTKNWNWDEDDLRRTRSKLSSKDAASELLPHSWTCGMWILQHHWEWRLKIQIVVSRKRDEEKNPILKSLIRVFYPVWNMLEEGNGEHFTLEGNGECVALAWGIRQRHHLVGNPVLVLQESVKIIPLCSWESGMRSRKCHCHLSGLGEGNWGFWGLHNESFTSCCALKIPKRPMELFL